VFGAREAAWPLIRTDLRLSYVQIGLLLTLPSVLGALVAPAIGILGDSGHRRRIVLAGGVAFAAGLAATSAAWGFGPFLAASLLLWLASGAFVSLSQASLMDLDPAAHERNMARWTAAGSVGVLIGPLALAGGAAIGVGWRGLMIGLAVLTIPFVLAARPLPHGQEGSSAQSFGPALRRAVRALRRRDVLRWLMVLELTDLLGDVFYGYLALYFVDVVGVNAARAALSVAVWSGAGLVGDWLIIPVLARVDGLRYLRFTAGAMLLAYPAFLLAPGLGPKLGLLALVGLLHAGWYAIPKGRLFTEMSGASGTTVALTDLSGLVGRLSPAIIGLAAQRVGLGPAMWGLIVAPIALLMGLPRRPAGAGAIPTSSPTPRD
jgi:MFS transporter, FSR family, fosmidomycin resistance protein